MRQERHINDAQTTLNGAINASTPSVTITDGSVFPSEGDFRIVVDSELMIVTARSTNVLTVVRGQESTPASSHSDSATVMAVITCGALDQFWSDFDQMYIPYNTPPKRIFDSSGVPIGESSFTWYNQSTSTVEDLADGSIFLTTPANSGSAWRGKYVTPPSTPWTVTAAFSTLWLHENGGGEFPQCGITVENSGDSKLEVLGFHWKTGYSPGLQIYKMTDYSTYNSDFTALKPLAVSTDLMWLRFEDDGVDHKQYISIDGVNWLLVNSASRTAWLSNGGDRVGFGQDAVNNDYLSLDHFTYLKHWSWS